MQGRRAKSYGAAGDTRRRMEDEDDRAQKYKGSITQKVKIRIRKMKNSESQTTKKKDNNNVQFVVCTEIFILGTERTVKNF